MKDNLTFLYVEDDEYSREVMQVLLSNKMGYQDITIFEDSENFEERLLALNSAPDVIFLDIHVKPINGFEMLNIVRKHPQFASTAVIALTASVTTREVTALITAGFNEIISKPVDQSRFPELLKTILSA